MRGRVYDSALGEDSGWGQAAGATANFALQAFGIYQGGRTAKESLRTDREIARAQATAAAQAAQAAAAARAANERFALLQSEREQLRLDQKFLQAKSAANFVLPALLAVLGIAVIYQMRK